MAHFRDQLSHLFIEELIYNSVAYYEQPKYVTVCFADGSTAN